MRNESEMIKSVQLRVLGRADTAASVLNSTGSLEVASLSCHGGTRKAVIYACEG